MTRDSRSSVITIPIMILDPTSDIASNDVAAIDIGFTSDASGIYMFSSELRKVGSWPAVDALSMSGLDMLQWATSESPSCLVLISPDDFLRSCCSHYRSKCMRYCW